MERKCDFGTDGEGRCLEETSGSLVLDEDQYLCAEVSNDGCTQFER